MIRKMASVEFNLANGIQCIAIKKTNRLLVTSKVFVKVGSRHDEKFPGLAHIVEHLLFRADKQDYYRNICQIEGLGGKIKAQTTKEYTEYSLVIIKENWLSGLKLLYDILTKQEFAQRSIKREKKVIIEEILNSYSKLSTLWDIFAQSIWKDSPLRNPIRGYTESINEITLKNIEGFYRNYYTGCNMVIIVIGDINVLEIKDKINEVFSGIKPGYQSIISKKSHSHTLNQKKEVHVIKDTIQTNLLMGYPGVSINDNDINAFRLINKIIGNGESSRLYKKLRVFMNIVYSISSTLAIYEDTGFFVVWTNFNHTKNNIIMETILDEFNSLRKKKIDDDELKHAIVRYKRDIMITHDNDNTFSEFIGTSLLLTGKVKKLEEIIFEIESVTSDQLYELANNYFLEHNRYIVTIGRNG